MKCSHCNTAFNAEWHFEESYLKEEKDGKRYGYQISHIQCPECDELIIQLEFGKLNKNDDYPGEYVDEEHEGYLSKRIHPIFTNKKIAPQVPKQYQNEYSEAISVLTLSPKSSAALSRRIVQTVLREELEIKDNNLSKEIDKFIALNDVPSYLKEAVDAIRNIGNFAAHPSKSKNTGEIVEVEPEEAEWLLEVIDALFDFVFVQPEKLQQRKQKLNKKLEEIGKPPMKESS